MDAQVAVIGAGVMGLFTALSLRRDGIDVVLLERFEAGHGAGSSHGPTRVFRYLYDDPLYVEMAAASLPRWRAFDEAALEMTGGLQIDDPEIVQRYHEAMAAHNIRTKMVEPDFIDVPEAMWTDGVGVLHASRIVARARLLLGDVVREGVVVDSIEPRDERVTLRTSDGDVTAQTCVVAAGAWARDLVAPLDLHLDVRVSREQVLYFRCDATQMIPWVHGLGHWIYAVPMGGVLKIAEHGTGAETSPDERSFELDEAGADRVVAYVRKYLPEVDSEIADFETCLYTNTADGDFVIDRCGPVVIASPCSGHGFKFAPLIGDITAALALGGDPPIRTGDRFRLSRKRRQTWRS